ncbi:MAG: response regulator [Pseudomonadota bacterium]|uniref:Response regulator n=1 Tax=Candidatus Desulfatibia profunda TaxID=2841695 RepID=A0A8J6TL49_9BACT|nr:response regulator [Candidatus Desulfatibia profunda]
MEKYKILLVDDDPFILQSIAVALEQEGYHVATAANGKQAIELIEEKKFDLVLTDLVMDPVDGIGVLRKAKEEDPDTIVIILTGFGDLLSAIEALRLDADDYLLKPCEPEELSFRISSCLEKLELKRKIRLYETIVPVCCVCKSIRDDTGKEVGTGEWMPVEEYILTKARIAISPTYCPDCVKKGLENLNILKDRNNSS